MKLSPEQKHSAAWLVVKAYANERLNDLRARLESDVPEKETIQARASIRELKRLLDLEHHDQQGIEVNDE